MHVVFLFSIYKKRNDVADLAWGTGFIVVAASFYLLLHIGITTTLLYAMVGIWGLRLSVHLYRRNKGKPEDFRYKAWREKWGRSFFWRSWLQVYLLQGFFMCIISLPIIYAPYFCNDSLTLKNVPGLIIWFAGIIMESIADEQLLQFSRKKQSREDFIRSGLWKYSRHPNYFGEILVWWGIFFFIAPCPGTLPAILSPITITLLLRYVSGVPMLERKFTGNKNYEEYKRITSVLIPWPPRKS
jgi:steroid 5-alpha reductase family enzyme